MKRFSSVRRVEHGADEMFALVGDVARYPEFVPYCERLVVRSRRPAPDEAVVLTASMTLGYKVFNETFGCRVVLNERARSIDVTYLDGPFKHLVNRWRFVPLGDEACEVDFYIEYALRSRSLGLLVGSVFDRAFEKLSEAFEARADEIHRRPAYRRPATV